MMQHLWLNAHRWLVGPLCFVLALSTLCAERPLHTIVASPALVFLSAISYNLYLWHLEIMVWVRGIGLAAPLTVLLAVPLAVGVAALITYRFERPILNLTFAQIRSTLRAHFRERPLTEGLERVA